MQSVRVFECGTQESVQRAPVQSSPVRTDRWPAKKARYSHNMSYVQSSAARPPPAVHGAVAQTGAAVSTAKVPAFSCWGCGETTHRRAECTSLTQSASHCPMPREASAVGLRWRWPFDGTSRPEGALMARTVKNITQRRLTCRLWHSTTTLTSK